MARLLSHCQSSSSSQTTAFLMGKATGGRVCLQWNIGNTAQSISNSWLDAFDRFEKGFGPSLISFLLNSTWTFFGCNETISVCKAKAQ